MGVTFTIILLNSTVIGGKATKFENNDLAQGGYCTDSSFAIFINHEHSKLSARDSSWIK